MLYPNPVLTVSSLLQVLESLKVNQIFIICGINSAIKADAVQKILEKEYKSYRFAYQTLEKLKPDEWYILDYEGSKIWESLGDCSNLK